MNEAGNEAGSVTVVLPDLPFDIHAVRDFIFTDREAVGRNTPLGRHYSKFGEQTENFLRAETIGQALLLKADMIETHKQIKKLNRVRVAAPSLSKGDRG